MQGREKAPKREEIEIFVGVFDSEWVRTIGNLNATETTDHVVQFNINKFKAITYFCYF